VRVYDRRRLVTHSPEDIGGAPGLRVQELLKDHRRPPRSVAAPPEREPAAPVLGWTPHPRATVPCTVAGNRDKVQSVVQIRPIRKS
jgi:hypothetical protein